ncbi:hypothetical protein ES677_01635 [Bizionia gelidisalsuginis]|uniref:Outer membrane protein beta-barrel domain-containing protein n=2 Tax=Bizionia TaxID=283785 RepID=A0A8H2LBP1_9FLAO|nr:MULTISPECIES: hypothetical protein [Bizionia]TYB72652.1 hypothetical protein ES676_10790 [Bizionia saleffrena]TYC18107.1 hypothetical protein ES677_01635 [Bizionia gelidisalsuginis]
MKKLLLLFTLTIFVPSVNAQWSENNALYLSMDYNLGNYIGIDLNANYIYNETYSFKIGYTGNLRKPKRQPDDFSRGFPGLFTLGLIGPFDTMENYQIGAGRIIKLNNKGSIRLNLSMGIGLTTIKEATNWQRDSAYLLDKNYSYQYHRYRTLSLIINPKIEFPFTRIYGLSLSPMVQINKDRTYFGIGIGQLLGVLKKRDNVKK